MRDDDFGRAILNALARIERRLDRIEAALPDAACTEARVDPDEPEPTEEEIRVTLARVQQARRAMRALEPMTRRPPRAPRPRKGDGPGRRPPEPA